MAEPKDKKTPPQAQEPQPRPEDLELPDEGPAHITQRNQPGRAFGAGGQKDDRPIDKGSVQGRS